MRRLKLVAGILAVVFLGWIIKGFCADSSGGMELVKDPTLSDISKDPGFWRARPSEKLGKQVRIDRTGKGHCLMLEVLNNEDVGDVAWQYNTPYKSELGAGELNISFWIKTQDVITMEEDYMWARPFFALIGHINTDKGNVYKNFPCSTIFKLGTNDWTKYELKFFLPDNVTDIAGVFNLRNCTGKMWIDDFSMVFNPISDTVKEKPITVMVRGEKRQLFYKPRYEKEDAPLGDITQEERDKGYLTFIRDPRDIYPVSIPKREEVTNRMRIFAAPGEYEPAWLAIYALKDLKSVEIELSDLVSKEGDKISKENIDLRIVKCWPQGDTGIPSGKNIYSIIPELLLKQDQVDVPVTKSQNFYFIIKVPQEAKPGRYSGNFLLKSENVPSSRIELNLRVLPFNLDKPALQEMTWVIHTTGEFAGLQKPGMSVVDAATVALKDMKERGIESISLGCVYGAPAEFKVEEGKLKLISFPKVTTIIPAMKNAGMKGPLIIHCGDMLEYQVAAALDVERPQREQKGGVSDTMKTEEFRNAFKDALREIDRFVKELGGNDFDWYYEGLDECGAFKARHERALWQWGLAKEAGFKGACFMHGTFWEKIAPYMDIQIFGCDQLCGNPEDNANLLKELKVYNNLPYNYGASGTYGDEPGGLMSSRWGTGFLQYISGAKGEVSWLYHAGGITDTEGVNHISFYPLLTYATPGNVLTPTLQWEGIREGIDDYCYVYTLADLIEKAKKSNKASGKVKNIEHELNQLLATIPWYEDYNKIGVTFTNDTATKLRWQIATWIMELM